jgi:hypothetical protein
MFSFADIARNVPDGLVDLVESPQSTRPKFVSDGPMIKKVVYHHPEHILDLLLGRPLRRVVRSDPQPGRDGHDQSGPHVSPDAHSTVKRPPSPSGATVDVVQTSDVSTTVDAVAGAVQAIAPPDLSETGEFPSADENHTRQFEHEDIIADELHDQDILERFTDTDLLVLAQLAGIYTRRQALVGTQTSYNEEDEDRRGVVAEFQAHALKTDWSDARKYCLLYRSIVPYAYFAATSIVDHAEREKKEAKQDYSAPGAADRQTMGMCTKVLASSTCSNNDYSESHSQESQAAAEGTGALFTDTCQEGPPTTTEISREDVYACRRSFAPSGLSHRERCTDCSCGYRQMPLKVFVSSLVIHDHVFIRV